MSGKTRRNKTASKPLIPKKKVPTLEQYDIVPKLARALGTTEGWALLAFLETPHGALAGVTPRLAIEQGQAQRVLEAAGYEGN